MKSEVCCIKINSFDDFKYPLNELSKGWLFRGHERAEWALQTSVERILKKRNEQFCKICNCNMSDIDGKYHFLKLKDEYFAIEEYEKLAFLQVPKMKKIELLARMQHYGTPTRLLDVTPSFLIALFFAYENYGIQDRAIWAFNERVLYEKSPLCSELSKKTFSIEEEELSYTEILRNKNKLYNTAVKISEKCFSETSDSQKAEYSPSIIPLKIIGNNNRLMAQNGAFLFPTTLLSFEENLFTCLGIKQVEFEAQMANCLDISEHHSKIPWQQLVIIKFVLPHNLKVSANKLLRHANISARSIYPDEIGLAKSIRYW